MAQAPLAVTQCPHIQWEIRAGTCVLTLARADKKNALSQAMYDALAAAICWIDGDPSVKALVLCGQGSDFCAGNDLADFAACLRAQDPHFLATIQRFMNAVIAFDKPLVAAVHGGAIGIGATLLLHCDYVVAAPTAYFSFPFVAMGLCPEFGCSVLLPQRVGQLRAREWLFDSAAIDAHCARECGFINAVDENPVAAALTKLVPWQMLPEQAVARCKKLLNAPQSVMLPEVLQREFDAFEEGLRSDVFAQLMDKFAAE